MTHLSRWCVPTTAALLLTAAACGGSVPETRFYQLSAPRAVHPPAGPVLVLEPLEADQAYDDDRIVYRPSAYRLDYYHYHRWSSSPGVMVSAYLEQALERSGRFRAVVRQPTPEADLALGGRVIAIEEIDASRTRWLGRIALELTLKDLSTGTVVWSRQLEETVPLAKQSPEGLARALSVALDRIVRRMSPEVAQIAETEARRRAEAPAAPAPTRP